MFVFKYIYDGCFQLNYIKPLVFKLVGELVFESYSDVDEKICRNV